MTEFTSLAQAMTGAVAQQLGHQVRSTLLEDGKTAGQFGVYATDPAEGR